MIKWTTLLLFLLLIVGVMEGGVSADSASPSLSSRGASGQAAAIQLPPPSTGTCRANIHADIDSIVENAFNTYIIPGMTLAVTQDGAIVCEKGYGYRRVDTQALMQPDTISSIGSVTKVLTTFGMMHLIQETPGFGITSVVYQNTLTHQDYEDAYVQGVNRHYPIVGQAIGNTGNVVTWYSDFTYTVGSSWDLDSLSGPQSFTLPNNRTMDQLVGIARGGTDNYIYAWYNNGTYSVGRTPADLDDEQLSSPYIANQNAKIVGVSLDKSNGRFYAYYHDGTLTSGTSPANLKNRWNGDTIDYVVPGSQSRRYDIIGVARTLTGRTIVWFSDDMASRGSGSDLGEDTGLYSVERPSVSGARQGQIDQYESIQIRHLLTHTAGFTESGDVAQAVEKYSWPNWDEHLNQLPYKDIHRYILSTRLLLFAPGTDYRYSNHGMGVVGHIIEERTGEDWYDYLHSNVLIAAGAGAIRPSGSVIIDEPADRVANPHTISSGQLVVGTRPLKNHSNTSAGGLMGSAGDLVRVILATDRDATYPDVLNASTLAVIEAVWFPNAAPQRLLGWEVSCESADNCADNRRLGHGGKVANGLATMARYDNFTSSNIDIDGISVALVVNGPENNGFGTTRLHSIMDDIAEVTAASTTPPTSVDVQSFSADSTPSTLITILFVSIILATALSVRWALMLPRARRRHR